MIFRLSIILLLTMQSFIQNRTTKIEGKNYLQPKFAVQGYEQFFLPKLSLKGTEHVYFNNDDIMQLYKQKNIDPNNLQCNLKYDPEKDTHQHQQKPQQKVEKKIAQKEAPVEKTQVKVVQSVNLINNRPRPPLREKGFTHFIHIPFVEACRQTFQNIIKTQIDPNDQDGLVSVNTLHATIMVFRIRSLADLPKWQKILKSIKLRKAKVTARGVGIFPIKMNTNFTRVLYIKVDGLDEIIHEITSKAITEGLVIQKELSNINFDKKTDMYRAQQQHITLLKTKNEKQFIDATHYLRIFSKLNLGRIPINDIRLSAMGSEDKEGNYYDQIIVPADH